MKTFSIDGKMVVVIDKIHFLRVFSNMVFPEKIGAESPTERIEWFVELNFGQGGIRIPYPDQEAAEQCQDRITALIEANK